MGHDGWRNKAYNAAQHLHQVNGSPRVLEQLTEEERDWVKILEERFYAIYNKRLPVREAVEAGELRWEDYVDEHGYGG